MLKDFNSLRCLAHGAALGAVLGAMPLAATAAEEAILSEAQIDWAAAEASAVATATAEAALTEAFLALPASAEPTGVPVMLFGAAADLPEPGFVSQGSAYVAYYAQDDIQLSISGSKAVVQAGDALVLHHAPSAWESIGTGADYSLSRFGAYYTLRITCDAPTTDTRCTEPEYLTGLAQSLFVVKGQANAM